MGGQKIYLLDKFFCSTGKHSGSGIVKNEIVKEQLAQKPAIQKIEHYEACYMKSCTNPLGPINTSTTEKVFSVSFHGQNLQFAFHVSYTPISMEITDKLRAF